MRQMPSRTGETEALMVAHFVQEAHRERPTNNYCNGRPLVGKTRRIGESKANLEASNAQETHKGLGSCHLNQVLQVPECSL